MSIDEILDNHIVEVDVQHWLNIGQTGGLLQIM